MKAQVHFFDILFEKDLHLNAIEGLSITVTC